MGEDAPRPPAAGEVRKRTLSPPRKLVVELMQRINFGRIEGLVVRGGEPVFDPLPRVVRTVKIGGDNGPRPESRSEDFAVKQKVAEFLSHLEHLGNGVVRCIEVKYGLPFTVEIEELIEA